MTSVTPPPRWGPTRQRLAATAVLTAVLTGAAGAALGGTLWHVYGASAYVVIAAAAVFSPAAISAQVIGGQVLAGSVLVAPDRPAVLLLLPVVAGILLTAELLGVVARMAHTLGRAPSSDVRQVGAATLIGGGVFGTVALLGGLPGPAGMAGVLLAGGACVLLALLLVRRVR